MNAFERRENIIERMKIRKFDTAYSLAEEFGVSDDTIYRDIQELSCIGYAIQADAGCGGGIRWVGSKREFPFSERQMLALRNAIANASSEDKLVLEEMLRDKSKPEVQICNNDIFDLLRGGMSQTQLARELGVSGAFLSMLLSGKKKPSARLAERISNYKKEVFGSEGN